MEFVWAGGEWEEKTESTVKMLLLSWLSLSSISMYFLSDFSVNTHLD